MMWDFLTLNGMTVAQLRVIARGLGIPRSDDMIKAELVYGIMDVQAGSADETVSLQGKEARNGWEAFLTELEKESDFRAMVDLFVGRVATLLFSFLRKCEPSWDTFEVIQEDGHSVILVEDSSNNQFSRVITTRSKEDMGLELVKDFICHDSDYAKTWSRPRMDGKWGWWLSQDTSWIGDDGFWALTEGREKVFKGMQKTRYVGLEWNNLVNIVPELYGKCIPNIDDKVALWERAIGSTAEDLGCDESDPWAVPIIILDLKENRLFFLNHLGEIIRAEDDPDFEYPFFDWRSAISKMVNLENRNVLLHEFYD